MRALLVMTFVASAAGLSAAVSGGLLKPKVVCLGETLFDSLPHGVFLGGAPLNVAVHAAAMGVEAMMVSAVGDDALGEDAIGRLRQFGVDTLNVQQSPLRTGFVTCRIGATGDASYNFQTPAAWDDIRATAAMLEAVAASDALVHGSLALRHARSAAAVVEASAVSKRRVFDLNLRQPFVDRARVLELMPGSWILKMNEEELLEIACEWCGFAFEDATTAADEIAKLGSLCRQLRDRFKVDHVVVTRAEKGALLLSAEHGLFSVALDTAIALVADTVGAGDAFTARLLAGFLSEEPPADAMRAAALLSAWVVTKNGATPDHNADLEAFLETHTAHVTRH